MHCTNAVAEQVVVQAARDIGAAQCADQETALEIYAASQTQLKVCALHPSEIVWRTLAKGRPKN